MNINRYILMPVLFKLLSSAAGSVQAQTAPAVVTISSKKNPGNLVYSSFYSVQERLASYVPPEPRHIDMRLRIAFTGLSELERDAFAPTDSTIAIVGAHFERPLSVAHGGYFMLPKLEPEQSRDGEIMFNGQTRRGYIEVAWLVRVAATGQLAYRDFDEALREQTSVRRSIFWFDRSLAEERRNTFDAIKACFQEPDARILIDGAPVASQVRGYCHLLPFDSKLAQANPPIDFVGRLDALTLENSKKFLQTLQ